jgi:hypothetical protein
MGLCQRVFGPISQVQGRICNAHFVDLILNEQLTPTACLNISQIFFFWLLSWHILLHLH